MKKRITRCLFFLVLATVAGYVFGRLGELFWLFDLFSHWQLQYSIISLLLVILCVFFRRKTLAIISLVLLLLTGWPLLTHFESGRVQEVDLYFLNALYTNAQVDTILDSIEEHNPKMVSIVELPEDLAKGIKKIGYRRIYEHFNKYQSFGFYVRNDQSLPDEAEAEDIFPYPIGQVQVDDLMIYTVHPYPGILWGLADDQRKSFAQIRSRLGARGDKPFFIVGDFNSSIFSPVFQKYFGSYQVPLRFTWHRDSIFALPIDHAFGNIPFVVDVADDVGSDHRPLIIDLKK